MWSRYWFPRLLCAAAQFSFRIHVGEFSRISSFDKPILSVVPDFSVRLCSAILTFNWLQICPVYCAGQSLQRVLQMQLLQSECERSVLFRSVTVSVCCPWHKSANIMVLTDFSDGLRCYWLSVTKWIKSWCTDVKVAESNPPTAGQFL